MTRYDKENIGIIILVMKSIEEEAADLILNFYDNIKGMDTKKAKQCAIIHIGGLEAENLSLLEMANLHMDNRAALVLNNRLSHLTLLKEAVGKI